MYGPRLVDAIQRAPGIRFRTDVGPGLLVDAFLRSSLVSVLVAPQHVESYVQLIDPLWSARDVRARVVGVTRETADTVSLLLRPNRNWRGHQPGQFVLLSVRVDGVRHTRAFSLSAASTARDPLRITIKRLDDGVVSSWVDRSARVGHIVEVSQALGHFVLPVPIPRKVLLISAGSGITPMMAMVESVLARDPGVQLTLLHYARGEVIFGRRLAELAQQHPRFLLRLKIAGADTGSGAERFSPECLERDVPDWAEFETFLCGPSALEQPVVALWRSRGLLERLHVERFRLPGEFIGASGEGEGIHTVTCAKRGGSIAVRRGQPLLAQLEAAGMRPEHGCRIGVCNRCRCHKASGRVRNLLSQRVSEARDESIQLCINAAMSDLVLDL